MHREKWEWKKIAKYTVEQAEKCGRKSVGIRETEIIFKYWSITSGYEFFFFTLFMLAKILITISNLRSGLIYIYIYIDIICAFSQI